MSKKQKTPTIALVGLENAGKTSLLKRLHTGKFTPVIPTYGMNADAIQLSNGQWLNVFDIGGQATFRELLWQAYVSQAQGVIFILDSAEPTTFREANRWFWRVSNWAPQGCPILFLANKSDLENRINLEEIEQRFALKAFENTIEKPMKSLKTSIVTGEGLEEAMNWLVSRIFS